MKSEWHEVPLRALVGFISKGITPSYADGETETTIRVLNQKCNRNHHINYAESRLHDTAKKAVPVERYLKPYDILINSTGTGTAGRIAQIENIPCKTTVDGHMIIVRTSGLVTQKFLGYALKSHQTEILQLDEGSTGQTELNRDRLLNEIVISYPDSISEQNAIVAILEKIDQKLLTNQQINDHLQQQAAELYKSWFVEFSSATTCKMIDSEIGEIPYGWRVYRLSEFLPVITGKKNANVSSEKGKYPFFSCSQDFSWTDDYSFEGHAILVAGNGDFNVKWYKGKFEAYQRTYVLIPREERYTSWLFYAIKYNLAKITSAARGTVIKFITKGNLEDFMFAAPADLSSCEIIDTFAAINRKIDCLIQENYRLAAIRNSLLPKLMGGEIDVTGIEI